MGNLTKNDKLFLTKLGEQIAAVRKLRGITQAELGFRCDIEKSNMNRIEKGGTNPTIITLKKVSKELNIGLDELLKELRDSS